MNDRAIGVSFVLAAALFEAFGQIAFKTAACAGESHRLRDVLSDRRKIALGFAFFLIEGICWTLALRRLEVSVAHPLASSELIMITLLSRYWLGERIDLRRWLGVLLILFGTVLVGFN